MKIKSYKFRAGSRLDDGKAKAVAGRLKKIGGSTGDLTPEGVLNDARDASSPLHSLFEWNKTRAARLYNLEQARHLIRSVIVVYEDATPEKPARECRAYYHVDREDDGKRYVPTAQVLSDEDMRKALLEEALSEATAWRKRYEDLAELADVFAALDKVQSKRQPKRKSGKRSAA